MISEISCSTSGPMLCLADVDEVLQSVNVMSNNLAQ